MELNNATTTSNTSGVRATNEDMAVAQAMGTSGARATNEDMAVGVVAQTMGTSGARAAMVVAVDDEDIGEVGRANSLGVRAAIGVAADDAITAARAQVGFPLISKKKN